MRLEEVADFLRKAMKALNRKTGALVATVCFDDHYSFIGVGVWHIKAKDVKDWSNNGNSGLPPERWANHLPLEVIDFSGIVHDEGDPPDEFL
jgi:hypothetical protein